jgi:hypothetical protein
VPLSSRIEQFYLAGSGAVYREAARWGSGAGRRGSCATHNRATKRRKPHQTDIRRGFHGYGGGGSPDATATGREPRRMTQSLEQAAGNGASHIEQADLFVDPARWPRRPYCSSDLESGLRIRSLKQAISHPYISANPPHLKVWALFDIDRAGAANAWEDADLPPPAWTAINRANGHAHSAWGLTAPVLVDGLNARDAPMRYLCAIESMMRERLQADSGYSGLITKNPAHPLWLTLRGPCMSYDMAYLAEHLPGIEKHRPLRRAEQVGLGRNVTLFDVLRKWAQKGIRPFWGGGLQAWNAWQSAVNTRALEVNADLFGVRLLDHREVWHIGRSVGKWTWKHITAQGFSAWQAKAAGRSAKVRRDASEDKRASARLMAAAGRTQREIAAELDVNQSTVARWLA